MKITLEFDDVGQLRSLLQLRDFERDSLKNRVAQLEDEPLAFSLEKLAKEVTEGMTSLTPEQASKIRELIISR